MNYRLGSISVCGGKDLKKQAQMLLKLMILSSSFSFVAIFNWFGLFVGLSGLDLYFSCTSPGDFEKLLAKIVITLPIMKGLTFVPASRAGTYETSPAHHENYSLLEGGWAGGRAGGC